MQISQSNPQTQPDFDPELDKFLDSMGASPELKPTKVSQPTPEAPQPTDDVLETIAGASIGRYDDDYQDVDPWENFLSGITTISGPPELRTRILCDIAARVSAASESLDGTVDPDGAAQNVLVITPRAEAFGRQMKTFGADMSRVQFVEKVKLPEQFVLLKRTIDSCCARLTIFDPVYASAGELATDKDVRKFLEQLRKATMGRLVLLALNTSVRRAQAGPSAWSTCDMNWLTSGDGTTQRLSRPGQEWEFDVTPSGLRDGHTTDTPAAESRKSHAAGVAEGWLLAMTADGHKRPKATLAAAAEPLGITLRQLETAFKTLGMKSERSHSVPPVALWWREVTTTTPASPE